MTLYIVLGTVVAVLILVWMLQNRYRIRKIALSVLGLLTVELGSDDATQRGLVQFATVDELRKDMTLGTGGQVNWIDRRATDASQLRAHGRLVLVGPTSLGKTREAIELIQRAVKAGVIAPDAIIKPGANIQYASERTLVEKSKINRDKAVLLLVDDFPRHYSGNQLEQLARLLAALQVCKESFAIFTARTDQLTDRQSKWLEDQQFKRVSIGVLDEALTGRLLDNAAGIYGLQIDDAARAILTHGWGGTPGTIVWGLWLLSQDDKKQIDSEIAGRIVRRGVAEAWSHTKKEIIESYRAAEYLFEALGSFYSARVTPFSSLLLRYAAARWAKRQNGLARMWHWRKLGEALKYLGRFDVVARDGILLYPDLAAEGLVQPAEARRRLSQFLLDDHWLFRNPVGLRIYRGAAIHGLALYEMFDAQYENKEFGAAEMSLRAGIAMSPKAFAYHNLGVLLDDMGRKEEAEKPFRIAVKNDPNLAEAYSNLGVLLNGLGRKDEAVKALRMAVKKDDNLAEAHYNLGAVLDDLGQKEEAEKALRTAIEKDPNYAEAYYSLGVLLRQRGHPQEPVQHSEISHKIRPRLHPVMGLPAIYRKLGEPELIERHGREARHFLEAED